MPKASTEMGTQARTAVPADLPCIHGVTWERMEKRWNAVEEAGLCCAPDTHACECCLGPALKADRCTRCQ